MGRPSNIRFWVCGLLFGQQLAHKLAGPSAVVGRDVKMGDCSDHERAQSGDPDSALCCRGGEGRSESRAGIDHDDIRLDSVGLTAAGTKPATASANVPAAA